MHLPARKGLGTQLAPFLGKKGVGAHLLLEVVDLGLEANDLLLVRLVLGRPPPPLRQSPSLQGAGCRVQGSGFRPPPAAIFVFRLSMQSGLGQEVVLKLRTKLTAHNDLYQTH